MKTQDRAKHVYDIGERLANDRRARRSARKAADSATAVSNDLKRHGFREVIQNDRTGHHLGVIAEAATDAGRGWPEPAL
jgi:hypothetical protein